MTVRRVAGDINLGLVAVLCVVCRWPDRKLALRFITGFEVIGCLEPTGVFPPCDAKDCLERGAFMKDAAAATLQLMKHCDSEDADALLAAAKEDEDGQRGSRLFSYQEMNER